MRRLSFILFLLVFCTLVSLSNADETLTITTYYPSPYGVYNEMRARHMAIGDTYIDHSVVCWEGDTGCSGLPMIPSANDVDLVVKGNVGIGTTDPSEGGKFGSKFTIRQGDASTGLGIMNASGARRFAINPETTGVSFYVGNSGDTDWIRTMDISNAGKVGIGTTAPIIGLHIKSPPWSYTPASGMIIQQESTTSSFGLPDSPGIMFFSVDGKDRGALGLAISAGAWEDNSQSGDIVLRSSGHDIIFATATGSNEWNAPPYVGPPFYLSKMIIKHNGDVIGIYGNYHVSSDIRQKKDIVTIPNALDKVLALRGVNFKWKDPSKDDNLHMGMIAQEAEKVVPEVVHTADDKMRTKAVEYQYMVGLLVEAIKEQQKGIDELKEKVKLLEAKLNAGQ